MPGFLGGSSGSSGTSGEILFSKEFIDPVTKLRVSQPENLIDTDFEYGLQPTKWETVELINNTPSFFSKSGDTTIDNIISITTNAGTREITVKTGLDHGLAVGIPISVSGTKSITADGSYIINSIPNTTTFTYLCKDIQPTTASIEDLYSSIITGEFFQGSQLRISDSSGIETDGESISTLTVKTDSAHGFGVNTPFYFLNLNSTISQEFDASNSSAKSFDASNSATAQTFDGSNTLSSINIDYSNSAVVGGVTSTVSGVNLSTNTITVAHSTENFSGRPIGTPLYYAVTAASGYFNTNPKGVVFIKTTTNLGASTSTFQVSSVPDGDPIVIESSMSGTFQLANQARTFAGNNVDALTEETITILNDQAQVFDGANDQTFNTILLTNLSGTVSGYSGSLVTVTSDSGQPNLDFYVGRMVRYTTTGSAATGLTNNTTYWLDTFFQQGSTSTYSFTLRTLPGTAGSTITSISGGTGVQKFTAIGVSIDKDIFHIKNHGFATNDMLQYEYPSGGRFTSAEPAQDYYFVETVYDVHNFNVTNTLAITASVSGTAFTNVQTNIGGTLYNVLTVTAVGTGGSVTFSGQTNVDYLVVAGGGGGGSDMGGGGGAGGYLAGTTTVAGGTAYSIWVGGGGSGAPAGQGQRRGFEGGQSRFTGGAINITAFGGGGGASNHDQSNQPAGGTNLGLQVGSGGGASGGAGGAQGGSGYGGGRWGDATSGQGFAGGQGGGYWYPAGGGGASERGTSAGGNPRGGNGIQNNINGTAHFWAGGGGGSGYSDRGGNGGAGGGGGGAIGSTSGGSGINNGSAGGGGGTNTWAQTPGGAAGANTGGGGGGGAHYNAGNPGGAGGSGIVILRWRA
jgi:hypothetical protein